MTNGMIPRSQHSFITGISVQTIILESINDWSATLDMKIACDVVNFDFAKAFGRVSHSKLLRKISRLRIHPVICKWLEKFLSGRSF